MAETQLQGNATNTNSSKEASIQVYRGYRSKSNIFQVASLASHTSSFKSATNGNSSSSSSD